MRAALAGASSGDTIIVPAMTITLSSGELMVSQNVTIAGAGAGATVISGNNVYRVFQIAAGNVNISGVEITGGNGFSGGFASYGGGILVGKNDGLTVTNSTVSGNHTQAGSGWSGRGD